MKFIDDAGLTRFSQKIKEKFVQTINSTAPDNNGNVVINEVERATILDSPDQYVSTDNFIYRTTAKNISVLSGTATLEAIYGNMEITTVDDTKVINIPKPTAFQSIGLNQYNNSKITNATIDANNQITQTSGTSVYYCKAVGSVMNGYVAYNEQGLIQNIGWCESIPTIESNVITSHSVVTSTLASIQFENDGYIVVVLTDSENDIELCIHPQWSGYMNEMYETYHLDTVLLPTEDTSNQSLPLNTYGMPAIGNVKDEINFQQQKYIQRIGQLTYSESNLEIVEGYNVAYEYDNTNIFYVLTTPIYYNINVESTFDMHDFGTEAFINTTVPLGVKIIYEQNLRDFLRINVEPKKYMFNDITVPSNLFNETLIGGDYPWTAQITCHGVNENMVPEVFFDMTEAINGVFAPVAHSVRDGVIIYANEQPETDFIIPTIIFWQKTSY